ncbi:MAG: hypothetical protein ABUT20_29640 [Bacteroidota bacterium]
METQLADPLSKKKIIMQSRPFVNTFKICLPINGCNIGVVLQMFCGNPFFNKKKKYSYSIVGKIEGVKNAEATADIFSDYGSGNQLKDEFILEHNQFIFSNLGLSPAGFRLNMKFRGCLQPGKEITAEVNIEMKYTLKRIFVNGVTSKYEVKNIREPHFLLMQ